MKISELIALLQQRLATHGDREVKATSEGLTSEFNCSNVYLANDQFGGVLFIDVDANSCKRFQAVDPREGENCDRCHGEHHEPDAELAEFDGVAMGNHGKFCHYCLGEFRMEE